MILNLLCSTLLVALGITQQASSLAPKDAKYLGCFSAGFVNSNPYYKVKQQVTFDRGVSVCLERLTMYAGLQEYRGWPGENLVFCGNELLKHSAKVDNRECIPCKNKTERQCGGEGSVAVYQLRDSTPLSVFIGTYSSGIKFFVEGNHATIVKIPFSGYVRTMDYLYTEDEIVYIYDMKVYRCLYNHTTIEYGACKIITNQGSKGLIYGLAVDWTENKLYWDWSYTANIYRTDEDGLNLLTVLDYYSVEIGLRVDPYERILFFKSRSKDGSIAAVHSYALDTKLHKEFTRFGSLGVSSIQDVLAVDIHERSVYFVGRLGASYALMMMDYDGQFVRSVFEGNQLSDVRGLDIFNKEVVWVNYAASLYTVYRCKLKPRCGGGDDLAIIEQNSVQIYDVRIYHPERQTPPNQYLCEKLGCSHACVRVSLFVCVCECPTGTTLAEDRRTCREKTNTTGHRIDTAKEETFPESRDVKLLVPNTSTPTSSSSPERNFTLHEDNHPVGNFLMDSSVFSNLIGILLVILLLVIIFQLRANRSRGNTETGSDQRLTGLSGSRRDANRPTELRELTNHYMEIPDRSRKTDLLS